MINNTIEEVKKAKRLSEIPHLYKLVSKGKYYKIKKPPYRFGVYFEENVIEFIKFGTRENFYRDFPPV